LGESAVVGGGAVYAGGDGCSVGCGGGRAILARSYFIATPHVTFHATCACTSRRGLREKKLKQLHLSPQHHIRESSMKSFIDVRINCVKRRR